MLRNASTRACAYSCSSSKCRYAFTRPTLSSYSTATNPDTPLPPIRYVKDEEPLIRKFIGPPHVRLISQKKIARPTSITQSHAPVESQDGTERLESTIYALASAPGKAGIAVIKVSGPACLQIHSELCKNARITPPPRKANVNTLYHPTDTPRRIVDKAVVVYFPQPNTQTGQDLLEFYTHGGNATVKAVLNAISMVPSKSPIRYAEAGEFTRRAFYNGKLNMTQVEALGDQLEAETEQQHRVAIKGQSKNSGKRYEGWRRALLEARGEMEALIDFSEDQHFDESPTTLLKGVSKKVSSILAIMADHIRASHCGELLRKGIKISLLGPPNVGKSSLMNHIVGREASIVSHEAGTTRDIVEVSLDIRGYLCTFADTAGLRQVPGKEASIPKKKENSKTLLVRRAPIWPPADKIPPFSIEEEGIRRARDKALESDLVIALASVEESSQSRNGFEITYDAESLILAKTAPSSLIVVNKCEHVPHEVLKLLLLQFKEAASPFIDESMKVVTISCLDAQRYQPSEEDPDPGKIHALTEELVTVFENMTYIPPNLTEAVGVSERARQLLSSALKSLEEYQREASRGTEPSDTGEPDIVIAAEHLREAAKSLALITGRGDVGDVEDVLGVVFEKFCVGK